MVINLGHCIGSNVILNDHSLFKVWEYICLATFSEGRGCKFVDKVIIKPNIKTKIKSKVYV